MPLKKFKRSQRSQLFRNSYPIFPTHIVNEKKGMKHNKYWKKLTSQYEFEIYPRYSS